jgi:hypothetical protein
LADDQTNGCEPVAYVQRNGSELGTALPEQIELARLAVGSVEPGERRSAAPPLKVQGGETGATATSIFSCTRRVHRRPSGVTFQRSLSQRQNDRVRPR